jgi:nucleotide-binding universal stress UspA family protein
MSKPYQRLLVPIDGAELSEHAMQHALALARQLDAAVTGYVVEAQPALPSMGTHLPSYRQEVQAQEHARAAHAQRVLDRFAALAAEAGVGFDGLTETRDDVADAIAQAAQRRGCDMIVMATHGRGAFGELLFGSQTKRVLGLTTIPLLVVH